MSLCLSGIFNAQLDFFTKLIFGRSLATKTQRHVGFTKNADIFLCLWIDDFVNVVFKVFADWNLRLKY